jgi:type II secretory pathway component PulC
MIEGGILGIPFLRRFNLYIDLKNNVLILDNRPNFNMEENKKKKNFIYTRAFYMSKKDNKYYFKTITNFDGNLLFAAGVKKGDELISINNYPASSIYDRKITVAEISSKVPELIINILRDGQNMILKCNTKAK